MRVKFIFVSTAMALDAFFMGYAAGLNSRHVQVVDPRLPALTKPSKNIAKPVATSKSLAKNETKNTLKKSSSGHKEMATGSATVKASSGHAGASKRVAVSTSKPTSTHNQ